MRSCWAGVCLLVICASVCAADSNAVQNGKRATALVDLGDQGSGSGFCIDPSGLFITNNHVVVAMGPTGSIKVVVNPTEPDQQVLNATVLARSSKYDLAVLRVQNARNLVALPLGDDSKLAETDPVTAFGYPFGKMLASGRADYPGISINTGKVTALRRAEGKLSRLQIDAAVNPGNSGGPVLDSNGKVVGIVVSGVMTFGGMTGVNFAIPVSKLREFLAVPYARIIPPKLNWSMRYEPLEFKAALFQFGAATSDESLELVFDEPGQKPRTVPLVRQPDGFYHATAAPMVKPADSTLVPLSALSDGGLVHGWSADHPVHVGGHTVNLSQVNSIVLLPKPSLRTTDDRVLDGPVSDLGKMTVESADKKPETSIDLGQSALILCGDSSATNRQVHYRLIVRRRGEILRQTRSTLTLARSASADPPVGQVEDSALADEVDARTLELPFRIYSAATGGGGRYLAMFLSAVRLVAVVDLYAGKVAAYIPCDDDDALVAAGLDKLVVADNHAHEVRVYDLSTARPLTQRRFDPSMHFRRVAMGSSSSGPVVLMDDRGIRFYDLATLADLPLETDKSIVHWDDLSVSADGSTLTGWKLTDPPATSRVRLRNGRGIGITIDKMTGQVYPNFDGSLLLGSGSVFSDDLRTLGENNDMYRFLPCDAAGLYIGLTVDFDEAGGVTGSVFDATTRKVIAALPSFPEFQAPSDDPADMEESSNPENRLVERIPLNARVILDPAHDLLATVPLTNDRVILRKFRLDEAMAKNGTPGLYVQSTPQTHFETGSEWNYSMDVRGGKPPLKYVLQSAPAGMRLSADGKLTWTPPAKLASGELLVSAAIADSQQHHLDHTFLLSPRIAPPQGAAQTQPAAGQNAIDLFPLLHDDLYVIAGKWKWNGDRLHVDEHGEHPRVQVACQPLGSYRLHVEFTLLKGTEVDLMVPAGAGCAAVVLNGWDGSAAITDIKGLQPPRFMKRPFKLEVGHKYAADVFVELGDESARIKLSVDGKQIFNWRGQQEVLHANTSPWRLADPKSIGLGVTDAVVDFTAAWVEPISDRVLTEYLNRPGSDVSSYLAEWKGSSKATMEPDASGPAKAPSLVMDVQPGTTVSSSYVTAKRFSRLEGRVRGDDPAMSFKIVCDGTPLWKSTPDRGKVDQTFSLNVAKYDAVELVCSGGAKAADGKWVGVRLLRRDDARLSPDLPLWSSVGEAFLNNHMSAVESRPLGPSTGREFDDIPSSPAILTGLRVTYHKGNREQFISSLQGIYLRPDGTTFLGEIRGKLAGRPQEFRAPDGYAVASIGVKTPDDMRSLQVNYQRIGQNGLEPQDTGDVPMFRIIIGGGNGGEVATLESKNRPIIGFGGYFANRLESIYIFTAP